MTKSYVTDGHKYFEAKPTALTIPKSGAMSIYCGDAPRYDDVEKTTSYQLRAPILIMPPDLLTDADETIELVAKVLNENAGRFFDSARKSAGPAGAIAETLIRIKDRLSDQRERDAINEAVAAIYKADGVTP